MGVVWEISVIILAADVECDIAMKKSVYTCIVSGWHRVGTGMRYGAPHEVQNSVMRLSHLARSV